MSKLPSAPVQTSVGGRVEKRVEQLDTGWFRHRLDLRTQLLERPVELRYVGSVSIE